MNKNTYCVYMHKNKINGKIYVGSTKYGDDPNLRWRNGKHYSGEFKNDINKYGWDEFEHYIIQNNLSEEEANELEILNIIAFNTTDSKYGYNERIVGNHLNEQSIQQISESLKNYWSENEHPFLNKHHSEETKTQIAKSLLQYYSTHNGTNKGKNFSEETKQKMSKARKQLYEDGYKPTFLGKSLSEEHKQKIRDSLKGKIYIHKDNIVKCINSKELDYYISLGFVKGRK